MIELDRLVERVRDSVPEMSSQADLDQVGDFPSEAIQVLHRLGVIRAALSSDLGGAGLARDPRASLALAAILQLIGRSSLSLGRLYEGHVNAIALIERYGNGKTAEMAASIALSGELLAVWNTQTPPGLTLIETSEGFFLRGGKTFASGAGHFRHALVTVERGGCPQLLLVSIPNPAQRVDFQAWHASGMRASATAAIDLTGICVTPDQFVGQPGDYARQPEFSGGAWRVLAVQIGGIAALIDHIRQHVSRPPHREFLLQRARFAEAVGCYHTARLWVKDCAINVADPTRLPDDIVCKVNLARGIVERQAMRVIALVQQGIGAKAFFAGVPIDRVCRDLAFYLRQPAPDLALDDAARHMLDRFAANADDWL